MKDGPAECRNRQPLGNISNLVTNRGLDDKKQPEICQLEEQVIDIDAADAGNELAVVEYVDELYKFYKLAEVCDCSSLLIYSSFFLFLYLYRYL